MNFLEVQIATECANIPGEQQFQYWVDTVLSDATRDSEIVIRLVDFAESAELNQQFRNKTGPTNILSFPFEPPAEVESDLLGDLVICAPLIAEEALQQHKPIDHHWAHITVHGILHLLGYDHIAEQDAEEMEAVEVRILTVLHIPDPYQEASTP
ncbi:MULTISPECIES: rRNA maturation RNase YbeY [Methylomonas]|uniref:rRNA maturation RNase YbeY n=1 Tax=Methylomonas TaxID=416 RepID=UPI001231A7A2|nr:rRNA maturation RNase YbeY [Methylomonas rhizoryzae]